MLACTDNPMPYLQSFIYFFEHMMSKIVIAFIYLIFQLLIRINILSLPEIKRTYPL